jgi:hypothetical protein
MSWLGGGIAVRSFRPLLRAVQQYLRENGIKIANGTIVDATIIAR